MSERSLYPEAVEVHQKDLERTEESRSQQSKDLVIDTALTAIRESGAAVQEHRGGVVNGLRLSVNASDNTLFDVSAGQAYAPNGERIDVASSQLANTLSDYTLDTRNLICLFYKETQQTLQPHETDGTSRNTEAVATFELVALTQTEFDALPETFDSDLTQRAQDRCATIGVITANGVSIALVTGDLLQETEYFQRTKAEYVSTVIRGVNIATAGVPNLSDAGVGTLELIVTDESNKDITWAAPGDSAGSSANIAAVNGTQLVLSNDPTQSLLLDVVSELLPNIPATYTVSVEVGALYDPDGKLWSPADRQHRQSIGDRQTQKTNNPHGMAGSDLGDSFVRFDLPVDIGGGALSTQDDAQQARIVTRRSTTASVQRTLMWEMPGGGRQHIRFYKTDTESLEITVNARWQDDGVTDEWNKDQTGEPAGKWEFSADGSTAMFDMYSRAAGNNTPWDDASWDSNGFTFDQTSAQAILRGNAVIGELFLNSNSEVEIPRIDTDYAQGLTTETRTLMWRMQGDTSLDTHRIRVYHTEDIGPLTTDGGLEFVVNAVWDEDTQLWSHDDSADAAVKLILSNDFFSLRRHTTGGTWDDDSWDATPMTLVSSTGSGVLTVSGDYQWFPAKTMTHTIVAAGTYVNLAGFTLSGVGGSIEKITDPSTGSVVFPLQVPNGATLSTVNVACATNGTTWQGEIFRVGQLDFTTFGTSLNSGGATSFADDGSITSGSLKPITMDQFQTIDNDLYYYILVVDNGPASNNDDIRINAVEVKYTLSTLET